MMQKLLTHQGTIREKRIKDQLIQEAVEMVMLDKWPNAMK